MGRDAESSPVRGIRWSDEFEAFDASAPVVALLECLAGQRAYYILIRRAPDLLYVFLASELDLIPGIRRFRFENPPPDFAVDDAVELHEHDSSGLTGTDGETRPHTYPVPAGMRALPSRDRFVALDAGGNPLAVGEDSGRLTMGGGGLPPAVELGAVGRPTRAEPPPPRMRGGGPPPPPPPATRAAPPPPPAPPPKSVPPPSESREAGDEPVGAVPDEGTDPVRFPSITGDRPLAAGQPVAITVDLLRERTDLRTVAGPVGFRDLPADWEEIELAVEVTSSFIEFQSTEGVVTVRRNASSVPAVFEGTVVAEAKPGEPLPVFASFRFRDRICGMAQREFVIGEAEPRAAPEGAAAALVVETEVVAPALEVRIIKPVRSQPGKLLWTLSVPHSGRVPGLPGRLTAYVDLGKGPDVYAGELYQRFAGVSPGAHVDLFRGAGDELWERTPEMFRQAYWALRAALGPDFTIQFITDDPYVPWELMRPSNEATGEVAEILALGHPVARWIGDYEGYLRQNLPRGSIVTVAPIYASAMDELPRAQEEAKLLIDEHKATRVPGKLADVKRLLREGPAAHVAVLHFAGHGEFPPDAPSQSTVKLEDGLLPALVVGARETKLGERDGPLVVFNACKVGLTGETLGASGGWADVFLKRRFSGFVAPLWPVYDDDAAVVMGEFFEKVVTLHQPVARVLQGIRARHAEVSPTFFAYLYYGDVNARLPA